MTREQLEQLVRLWRRRLIARDGLVIAAIAGVGAAVAIVWSPAGVVTASALAACVLGALMALALRARRSQVDVVGLTRHLDRSFPEFEESSALWLRPPHALNALERLQRRRVDNAARVLQRAGGEIEFAGPPRHLLRIPLFCAAGALVLVIGVAVWRGLELRSRESAPFLARIQPVQPEIVRPAVIVPPTLVAAEMLITPPPYTGRAARRVSGLNAEVEEGARIEWTLSFDRPVGETHLVFGAGERIPMRVEGGKLIATHMVTDTVLYHPIGVLPDGAEWKAAELYSLKVIKDQPAALQILQPALPRTIVDPQASSGATVMVEVEAVDDYGIPEAHLIGTVAKGTGEAVKFREQQIAFDLAGGEPQRRRLTKRLDLAALGLEPGDELYFHVQARDNREPHSNEARSETRFIVLRGPEQSVSTPGAGVAGVNLVPQYFRSQRQIIIDTEKLIAERATLSDAEFNRRSNDLGVDQQMLRQRYGQFLGQDEHFEGDGHDHSSPAEPKPSTADEVAARFGHRHDSADEATFFQGEAKATMRDVLAAMWEAEGLLRTNRPAEALVPENRALEILKTLQQSDRAYVQRVGFEAAPLKIAERRLRGDAGEVPERSGSAAIAAPDDAKAQALRALLQAPPWRSARRILQEELELARRVEVPLTEAATNDPQRFLAALQLFRRWTTGELLAADDVAALEEALLQMLPSAKPSPRAAAEVSPMLGDAYFKNLSPGQ